MLKKMHPEHNLLRHRPGLLVCVADKTGRIIFDREEAIKKRLEEKERAKNPDPVYKTV